jgi:DNA-binding MarR family transcriptional regulator
MTQRFTPGLMLQPFVVSQLVGTVIEGIVEGSAVSASEFAVTSSLANLPGVTPTALADILGLSPTTLSAMIKRLEQRGQVMRTRNPGDGRSYVLRLTAAGRATNRRNVERFSKAMQRLRANLDTDPEEVLEPMRRLETALRKTISEV